MSINSLFPKESQKAPLNLSKGEKVAENFLHKHSEIKIDDVAEGRPRKQSQAAKRSIKKASPQSTTYISVF